MMGHAARVHNGVGLGKTGKEPHPKKNPPKNQKPKTKNKKKNSERCRTSYSASKPGELAGSG